MLRRTMTYTHQMSFITPLPFNLNDYPFSEIRISANLDKVDGLPAKWRNPYKEDCFSIVEYLLFN